MIDLIIFGDLSMDIAHLKTFLEIFKTRHFGKAADKLFITQSAASARIKLLEEQLGVKLFTRDKRNIEPTPAGHRFYKYAEISVNGWEQARRVVALPEDYLQSLSIACMADIWHLFLNHWIVDIQKDLPEIALNLTIDQPSSISERLVNGALDLGFVFEPIHLPALIVKEIFEFKIKLFSSRPDLTTQQAFDESYIMVDWGASFAYEYAKVFAGQQTATVQTNYGVMALDIIKNKGGSGYLPDLVRRKLDDNLELYEVKDAPVFERKLYATYQKDREQQLDIEQVINTIKKLI